MDYSLNIGGSEWMIIIFVALVLILGTGKLPGAAKKLGKAVNEYNKAKNEIQEQMKEVTDEVPKISGPVETEREKLEMIAKSAGVKIEEKTDDELRKGISAKIGQKRKDESEKNGQKINSSPLVFWANILVEFLMKPSSVLFTLSGAGLLQKI